MEGLLSTGPTPSSFFFIKTSPFFFLVKLLLLLPSHFNPYLYTPRWRWHIYLRLHQIWTQSEKCTISSEMIPWPCFLLITELLGDSGRMTSYDLGSREGLSAILCLPSTGLNWKVQKTVLSALENQFLKIMHRKNLFRNQKQYLELYIGTTMGLPYIGTLNEKKERKNYHLI